MPEVGVIGTTHELPMDRIMTVSPSATIDARQLVVPTESLTWPLPTTFSTISVAKDSDRKTGVYPTNTSEEPMFTILPVANNTTLLARTDDVFTPNCGTSATRALWKWRNKCDRTPLSHVMPECWNRAPSISRCCVDPSDPPDAIKNGDMKICGRNWPEGEQQERMCTEETTYNISSRNVCECKVEMCLEEDERFFLPKQVNN